MLAKGKEFMKSFKLTPKTTDILKKMKFKVNATRIEGLNAYLQQIIQSEELLDINCVQSFLKADYLNFQDF